MVCEGKDLCLECKSENRDGELCEPLPGYFEKTPIEEEPSKCHYSCTTCKGPGFNDCLTCPEKCHRTLDVKESACPPNDGFFDKGV